VNSGIVALPASLAPVAAGARAEVELDIAEVVGTLDRERETSGLRGEDPGGIWGPRPSL
jgi:hypothetical protein